MDSFLELEVMPEVDNELKILIKGASYGFSGEADCYVSETNFLNFAQSLKGFPKQQNEVISFSSGESEVLSTFELCFTNANSSGHIRLEVLITYIDQFTDSIVKKYSSSFGLVIMPTELDTFQSSLVKVANPINIGQRAVLCSKI